MLIQSTDASFEANIKSGVSLVDFYADWCGPCKVMLPRLENLAKNNPDINVLKHNVDTESGVPAAFQVRSIPTLYILKDGKPFSRFVGVVDEKTLTDEIEKAKSHV